MARAQTLLKYDATNAGAGLTAEALRELGTSVAAVSTYPRSVAASDPVPDFALVRREGAAPAAVLAVTLAGQLEPEREPVRAALEAAVAEARRSAALVVLLANADPADLPSLARISTVDVVLGARSPAPDEPTRYGSTIIAGCDRTGVSVCVLTVERSPSRPVRVTSWEAIYLGEGVAVDEEAAGLVPAD